MTWTRSRASFEYAFPAEKGLWTIQQQSNGRPSSALPSLFRRPALTPLRLISSIKRADPDPYPLWQRPSPATKAADSTPSSSSSSSPPSASPRVPAPSSSPLASLSTAPTPTAVHARKTGPCKVCQSHENNILFKMFRPVPCSLGMSEVLSWDVYASYILFASSPGSIPPGGRFLCCTFRSAGNNSRFTGRPPLPKITDGFTRVASRFTVHFVESKYVSRVRFEPHRVGFQGVVSHLMYFACLPAPSRQAHKQRIRACSCSCLI